MATYYVRADGAVAAADKANATSSGAAATSLSLATMNTAVSSSLVRDGDVFILSSKGGVFSGATLLNATTNGITFRGETGFRPTLSFASTYRCQVAAVDRNTFENMTILNPGTSGIEFITSGSGHVVHNVEVSGSTNQAFSVENDCHATFYDVIGHGCVDDGLSLHGTSTLSVYGGHFYDNNQNVSHIDTSVIRCYGVKFSGAKLGANSGDLLVGAVATDNTQSYFYDCEFDGGVMGGATLGATCYAEFHRCLFKNRYVGTASGLTDACVHFSNGDTTRYVIVKMYSCEFWQPPTGKTQCLLRVDAVTSDCVVENCTFAQATEVYRGLHITGSHSSPVKNCAFYNCSAGVVATAAAVAVANCSFFANTADVSGTAVVTSGKITADPLFVNAARNDFRLSAGSPLISAGTSGIVMYDIDNKKYSYPTNIGAHSTEDVRPQTPYRRTT